MLNNLLNIFSRNKKNTSNQILNIQNTYPSEQLFLAVNDYSKNSEIRYVGGCVRKSILNEKIDDVDLSTNLDPIQLEDCLKKNNIKYLTTGKKFGTLTALVNGFKFEITSLRKDIITDGRHAKVEYTNNWKEDAEQLALLYERLRANRNHEYINLVDDNTTLLRQAQLNHDMLLRRQFINKMLRDILILICLFILSGFLNHMGYASTTILTINVVLLTLFGLNFLYSIYIRQKRHELNYKRFGKFLYPKIDQDTQLKYAEGVCSDDDSDPNSKKAKCGGFV